MQRVFFAFCAAFLGAAGCNHASQTLVGRVKSPHSVRISKPHPPTPIGTQKPFVLPFNAAGNVIHGVKTLQKVVALTFDDGPNPKYTRQILDILRAHKIHATFFMIGSMVKAHPETARAVLAAGHSIGNHTWKHPAKPSNPAREIERTDTILKRVLGTKPLLFRPPYGLLHNGLASDAKKEGDAVILWSAMGSDWSKKATASSIATAVCKGLTPGGIALLHDGGGNRSATVQALPKIIETLQARHFRFVTIPELLMLGEPETWSEARFWKRNGLKQPADH